MKVLLSLVLLAVSALAQSGTPALLRGFEHPTDDARPMMRWWWFGPSVAKPELERELRAMKAGGIGGVEIQAVYPMALDDERTGIRNLPFLSDDFIDAVRFTNEKAAELGMRVDLTLGSGWPYGGPHITPALASGRIRIDKVKTQARAIPMPPLGASETLEAVFTVNGTAYQRLNGSVRDFVFHADRDPSGEVWFFINGRTGMQVKRPAVGAEGFVLDHLDRAAIDAHLKHVGDRLLTAFGARPPHAVFCDSLEVYGSDWTPAFAREFERRRGYDIVPLLPALFSDMGAVTRSLRQDWGLTMTELTEANFYQPMLDFAHKNQTRFRIQGYGLPPGSISSYRLSDLPEGEGAQWKVVRASRWASSASHLLDRTITSSETWTWLHSPSFRATPLDLKAEADLHFLQGINQLIGHGWPYTPAGVEYPGWRLYAAAVFNDHNPWYNAMPEITRYLQRMSWLLRQGKPHNDIALYLSNSDAYAQFRPGAPNLIENEKELLGNDLMPRLIEAGYNLDFVDDGLLDRALATHKVVVVPNVTSMPVETARKLAEFAKRGGIVVPVRRLPDTAPGYRASAAGHAAVRDAVKVFAGNLVADENKGLAQKLHALQTPDLAVSAGASDFGFVHRKAEGDEIYFVANTGNTALQAEATFRVTGLEPEFWDPMTAGVTPAKVLRRDKDTVTVSLALAPYGSNVVVFSHHAAAKEAERTPRSLELARDWTVRIGTVTAPHWDSPRSWSGDEATKNFSGVAIYEKTIMVAPDFPRNRVTLDFGEGKPLAGEQPRNGFVAMLDAPVREAAVVFVNGERAGAAWCSPYRVDVTRFIRPGENKIRIEVGNTAMNYMAAHRLPDYRLLNLRYGVRFEPQDMDKIQVLPSGLLAPLRLLGE